MSEVKSVGLTYEEYLKQVRAEQFGWDIAEPKPITEDNPTVTVVATKKGKKKDE